MPVLPRQAGERSSRLDCQRTRHNRASRDQAVDRAPSASGGALSVLRDAGCRPRARGGQGDAVRAARPCHGDLSQDLPGSVLRAAAKRVRRPVRAHPQPGRPDEPAAPGAGRLRGRARQGRRGVAPGPGHRLRRDRRPDRGLATPIIGCFAAPRRWSITPRRPGAPSWSGP